VFAGNYVLTPRHIKDFLNQLKQSDHLGYVSDARYEVASINVSCAGHDKGATEHALLSTGFCLSGEHGA
jgi:hypothetical protein